MRGAKTVVEGHLKAPSHLKKARLLGADHGQRGFLWGRAVPTHIWSRTGAVLNCRVGAVSNCRRTIHDAGLCLFFRGIRARYLLTLFTKARQLSAESQRTESCDRIDEI